MRSSVRIMHQDCQVAVLPPAHILKLCIRYACLSEVQQWKEIASKQVNCLL